MHCRVGEWIVITNFRLSLPSGTYRHTSHGYKMNFVTETSITQSNLHCNNMYLDLKDFATIQNGSHDKRYLIGNIYFSIWLINTLTIYSVFYLTVFLYNRCDWSGIGFWWCGYGSMFKKSSYQNGVFFKRCEVSFVQILFKLFFLFTKLIYFWPYFSDKRLACCIYGKFAETLIEEKRQPNNGDICLIRYAKLPEDNGRDKCL